MESSVDVVGGSGYGLADRHLGVAHLVGQQHKAENDHEDRADRQGDMIFFHWS